MNYLYLKTIKPLIHWTQYTIKLFAKHALAPSIFSTIKHALFCKSVWLIFTGKYNLKYFLRFGIYTQMSFVYWVSSWQIQVIYLTIFLRILYELPTNIFQQINKEWTLIATSWLGKPHDKNAKYLCNLNVKMATIVYMRPNVNSSTIKRSA